MEKSFLNVSRNTKGITLPFALILTFIFSSLVGVAYLFVSVNILQMQSNLYSTQALAVAEGTNERIKARLNTKTKIKPSPTQEEKLKTSSEDEFQDEEDNLTAEEEFDEETESFDEYYADEVLKIARYITFREPPEESKPGPSLLPQANVEMIGDIVIPRGVVLNKGIMIVVSKDEKIDLKLKDIVPENIKGFRPKLPAPLIKSLTPNYSEANVRSSFLASGENLQNKDMEPRFSNKNILVEDIKAGPTIEFLIGKDVMPGLTRFYLDNAQSEFYIIPSYDGSSRPVINEVHTANENQFLEVKAGTRMVIKVFGSDLFIGKNMPVAIPDVSSIIPNVKDKSPSGKELTIALNINKTVDIGVHSLVIATEGGLSNAWLFNVLPPEEGLGDFSANTATVTSSLTLLDVRVVEDLLPLIDEEQQTEEETKDSKKDKEENADNESDGEEETSDEEVPEREKLSPFANVDLETSWLLETTCKVGKITKTVSEVIHRQIPNIHAGLTTNGTVEISGGGFQIVGTTNAMTTLVEPTYISNTVLTVEGPPEEPEESIQGPQGVERPKEEKPVPKSPIELGFTPGSFIAVYKAGERISDLDYSIVTNTTRNTIELYPAGLMDFHYEGDEVYQFIPPVISKEKIPMELAEKHINPKEFSLAIPNSASFKNIFKSNIEQFSEIADLYTNDLNIPKDELDIPLGYMGLSFVEGTPVYDSKNALTGKGILIIDTRSDNLGRPSGVVEIGGDNKNPIDFTGVVYIRGNARIGGNVNILGALILDNDPDGKIEIANDALGRISFDARAVKQTILSIPFTTKAGTVMISNKPISLEGYVQTGTQVAKLGASSTFGETKKATKKQIEVFKKEGVKPEEALVEVDKKPQTETIKPAGGGKSAEEELIDLF